MMVASLTETIFEAPVSRFFIGISVTDNLDAKPAVVCGRGIDKPQVVVVCPFDHDAEIQFLDEPSLASFEVGHPKSGVVALHGRERALWIVRRRHRIAIQGRSTLRRIPCGSAPSGDGYPKQLQYWG